MRRPEKNPQASWTLDYPFPSVTLSRESYEYVLKFVVDNEKHYAAFNDAGVNRNIEILPLVVAEFLRNCSPPNPATDMLRLVTQFAYFLVYLGDRIHQPGYRELLLDFWRIFEGKQPHAQPMIVRMAVGFMAELREFLGGEPDWNHTFFHNFRNSLSCHIWTSEHLGENIPYVEDYIKIRI